MPKKEIKQEINDILDRFSEKALTDLLTLLKGLDEKQHQAGHHHHEHIAVKVKRIYEPFSEADGYRILVDRLWPRGIKKEKAHIDKWMKEVAPSTALREWFDHDPKKWKQFQTKYHAELKGSTAFKELLTDLHKHKTVTFLYSSREQEHNHAIVLQQLVNDHED